MKQWLSGWIVQIPSMIYSNQSNKLCKKGVILFETIVAIALFFIIVATVTNLLVGFEKKGTTMYNQSVSLLKLEATKQFLDNNKNFEKLLYSSEKIFYDGSLLLNNVSKFSSIQSDKLITIDICLEKNKVCSQWQIDL